MRPRTPIVGIPCDHRMVGKHPFHMVGEKYITAVRDGADALPLLIPVLSPPIPPDELDRKRRRIPVHRIAVERRAEALWRHRAARGRAAGRAPRRHRRSPLLKAAIAAGKPVLCVCRGFQELNVAFGGTLHQHVQEIPGRMRSPRGQRRAARDAIRARCMRLRSSRGCLFADIVGAGIVPGELAAFAGHRQARARAACRRGRARRHRSRRCRCRTPKAFCSACSGIPNGAGPRTRSAARSSAPSAKRYRRAVR